MKRLILILAAVSLGGGTLAAQNTIEDVLARVEQASIAMEAQRKLTDAQKLEAKTGNYLANPSVEYESLWGDKTNRGNMGELTVTQAFDFPSAYGNRNKIARLKGQMYEQEGAAFRQQILLEAKMVCLEIIYLRQQQALLNERYANAEQLYQVYRQQLDAGSTNIIAVNKISIERLNAQTALNLNGTALRSKLEQLANLVGGEPIDFNSPVYPPEATLPPLDEIETHYVNSNPMLRALEHSYGIDQKSVALNRSLSLPQFEVGYRQNFGMEGKAKGFLVGISVPLFENKNKVKAAKARSFFAQAQMQSTKLNLRTELNQLYEQAQTLQRSGEELQQLLNHQNNLEILKKALDAGQIDIIEYFTEVNILFESRGQLLQIERDYRLATAQLFRYSL